MNHGAYLAGIVIALLFSAFFSGSESAIISVNRVRLQQKAEAGARAARLLMALLSRQDHLLITVLIGNNIVNVLLATLASGYLRHISLGPLATTLIVTPLLIIFGEILPKTMFTKLADHVSLIIVYPLRAVGTLVYPLTAAFAALTRLITRRLKTAAYAPVSISKEELKMLVTMDQHASDIPEDERRILERMFEFTEQTVRGVMTPLIDVQAVPATAPLTDAVQLMLTKGLSNIVVYQDRIDNPIGVVRAVDLVRTAQLPENVMGIVKQVPYLPVARQVDDVMSDLRNASTELAFVVNEYGAAIGLVTIEDILEEILGEIEDEYDIRRQAGIRLVAPDTWVAAGRLELEHVEDAIGYRVPKGNYETLAGFLLYLIKRIPAKGEQIAHEHLQFTILEADQRRIIKVKIQLAHTKERLS